MVALSGTHTQAALAAATDSAVMVMAVMLSGHRNGFPRVRAAAGHDACARTEACSTSDSPTHLAGRTRATAGCAARSRRLILAFVSINYDKPGHNLTRTRYKLPASRRRITATSGAAGGPGRLLCRLVLMVRAGPGGENDHSGPRGQADRAAKLWPCGPLTRPSVTRQKAPHKERPAGAATSAPAARSLHALTETRSAVSGEAYSSYLPPRYLARNRSAAV